MHRIGMTSLGWLVFAPATLLWPVAALAQSSTDETPTGNYAPLTPEQEQALRDMLRFDASGSTSLTPARPRGQQQQNSFEWNRTENKDGSSAVSVKRPLATEWDSKVGADFGLAPPNSTILGETRPLAPLREQNSTAAWANVN